MTPDEAPENQLLAVIEMALLYDQAARGDITPGQYERDAGQILSSEFAASPAQGLTGLAALAVALAGELGATRTPPQTPGQLLRGMAAGIGS